MACPLLHWDMLEAYVSGISFTLSIVFYRMLDQLPFMRRYRFDKCEEPVKLFQPDPNNSWAPLVIYLLAIHAYHFFFPKVYFSEEAPTVIRIVVEVLSGVVLYDFIFFWIHLGMHSAPSLAPWHKHFVHHSQTVLTASEVQHHSAVDASLQVLVNIVVQNIPLPMFGRKHLMSRLLHNIIVTYMLTEIHAGYDAFWSLHNLFPGIIGGAKRHEEHHRRGNVYYQQFFTYLDDVLMR